MLFAARLAGATHVLTLGGVQGLAAMAFGLFTHGGPRANILTGPGNRFVVAAKTLLFGEVGIDLVAGPTENAILADDSADPHLVATDLVGQAEHGFDSPTTLLTTSHSLAEQVIKLMPTYLGELLADEPQCAAAVAWRDYGAVGVCENREELCAASDDIASEHLQVMCRKEELDFYHSRLRNYGSLFLGEETNVSYGDKAAGPNHVLPTRRAASYTGGLNLGCFLKRLSYQRVVGDPTKSLKLAEVTARISRLEGMEGHARSADARLRRYLSPEAFAELDLSVQQGAAATNTDLGAAIEADDRPRRGHASHDLRMTSRRRESHLVESLRAARSLGGAPQDAIVRANAWSELKFAAVWRLEHGSSARAWDSAARGGASTEAQLNPAPARAQLGCLGASPWEVHRLSVTRHRQSREAASRTRQCAVGRRNRTYCIL
eukprot:CAMPEP_0115870738 /NCGR_PEP_ID=MMETSP0287-20121206/22490_1 /TAXON_ID=412157 /ORGANISM="Chrysochromulina rotalis, Strain UIO044" /LENGTH=433 /DNA_ID=CAMNT_0003325487 /DNA_START=1 /DNA_END=1301 /DNA_ORIENTATION=-